MYSRPKYKIRHHETPRKKHKQNTLWHKLQQYFLGSLSQGKRNKAKNKLDLIKLKSFYKAKETNKMKRNLLNGRKYLQMIWLIREDIKNINI